MVHYCQIAGWKEDRTYGKEQIQDHYYQAKEEVSRDQGGE